MAQRRIAIALELELPFPHHTQVFAGTQRYSNEHDWECVIDEFPGYRPTRRSPGYRRYDGIIARARPDMVLRARQQKTPLVNTWYSTPARSVPGVYPDFEEAARLAADHLLNRGFRRICVMDTIDNKTNDITQRILEQVVREAGGQVFSFAHPSADAHDAGLWLEQERVLSQALDQLQPPVGIFCRSSSAMRYVVNLCQGRGWHVPRDAAVISAIATPGLIDHPRPPISYIDMNWEQVGYEAAAMLDRLMDGQPPPDRPILVPPRGIVSRESTDYFAIDDEVVAQALNYISTHLRDRLTVERIAAQVTVSPRQLQLRFDAVLGKTVSGEVRRLRLEAARRMLTEKDRHIAQIARDTGFGTDNLMNRVFRRELGMTPSAYRRQALET